MITLLIVLIGIAVAIVGYCYVEKHINIITKTKVEVRVLTAQAKAFEIQVEQATKAVVKAAEQEAQMLKAVADRDARAAAIKASGAVKQVVADIKNDLKEL